ncbi:Hypothetical predicted protein [Paramuricea clavata]|uniref:Uncharacterized protein n=1 Tax=Paramuricea clavata TaxID=317549 RepID=A0A6S7IWT2_PARCT|nr:Hypothetical predicted protein [Paramuricea clavata]
MSFKVYINQGEWDQICAWVLKHKDIQTGGDLFGLWLDEQTAVVQFVLGPGNECSRTTISFFQDVDYLREAGTYLTKHHGLCNVGQWHSHHKINLFKPSVGDENTVWSNMPNLGLDRYIVFIANIPNQVTINSFLFQVKEGQELPVKHGKFKVLHGNSPLRLNEKVLQNVHSGAESFNQITRFEKEMKYIRNEDAIENLDISNENETSSYTLGNRVQHVTSVPTEEQKHTNRTTGKKTTSYAGTVQNTSKTIRHEIHPQHVPTTTPSRDNEEQLRNTAERNTPLSGQQKEKKPVVRVTSSEIPYEKRTVTLERKNDQKQNLGGAVPSDDNQGNAHHGNTDFGRGSMTSTTPRTDQQFRSDANKAFNSAESNYELNTRATQTGHNPATRNKFETRKRYVARQVTPIDQVNKQDISNQPGWVSLDQQKNLDQVSHGTTKATSAGQKRAQRTVTYNGGHQTAIIHQLDVRGVSYYDNVEKTEPAATPMDIDETETTITGHDVNRSDTPSGTIENIASNDQVADSDDDEMRLCGLFKNRKINGSDK